jgi:hypothetical protein
MIIGMLIKKNKRKFTELGLAYASIRTYAQWGQCIPSYYRK